MPREFRVIANRAGKGVYNCSYGSRGNKLVGQITGSGGNWHVTAADLDSDAASFAEAKIIFGEWAKLNYGNGAMTVSPDPAPPRRCPISDRLGYRCADPPVHHAGLQQPDYSRGRRMRPLHRRGTW